MLLNNKPSYSISLSSISHISRIKQYLFYDSEADFEDFLNNLYNHHSKSDNANTSGDQNSFRGDCRRRKIKRKK